MRSTINTPSGGSLQGRIQSFRVVLRTEHRSQVAVAQCHHIGVVKAGACAGQRRGEMAFGHGAFRFQLAFGGDDAFAACQLFIGEEASTAAAHLQHHLVADKAVVAEEEEQTVAALGEGVDADVVAQGLAFQRHVVEEGQRAVEQTVNALALVLEVDAQIADEQQVTLPRFHGNRPRNLPVGGVPGVKGDVVLGGHGGWFVDAALTG